MLLDIIILIILILAGLWTVMTRSLLRSAIGLASVSVVLSILMFRFHSPVAAVFELSVCSGFISVLFIAAISLTQPMTQKEKNQYRKEKLNRFLYLPFILVLAAVGMALIKLNLNFDLPAAEIEKDVRVMLWNTRQLDLIGQIMLLILGSFGVAVLFKKARNK